MLLIKQKQWKNLFQNLGFGILGILTIWLPFAIYFLVNGAFNDLFFASIIYNFSYATKIKSWLHDINSGTFYSLITTFFPCICALVTSALAFVRKKVPYAITLLIIFILETYLLCSGALFGQYCLAFIFQVGLLLNEIVLFKSKNEAYKFCYAILAGIIIVISHDIILDRSRVIPDVYNKIRAAGNTKTDCENLMDRNIGQIKNTTFTAYGDNPFKNIYLQYNLIPNNKFFVIQNWHQSFSNEARKEIVEDFQNNPPEYLLVGTKINNEALRETIENNYSISDSEKECKLYQKNI